MSLITLERDRAYAPCCYIVCRLFAGRDGQPTWDTRREEHTILIQTDHDYPGVARTFGWRGEDDDIAGAGAYLDEIHGFGRQVDDPGYFNIDNPPIVKVDAVANDWYAVKDRAIAYCRALGKTVRIYRECKGGAPSDFLIVPDSATAPPRAWFWQTLSPKHL